ncbi:hypothetical protein HMPREF1624_07737 [Sporothrix schenckii ATCC 58251]|uniref:Prenyltransferase alpha-alpha toroid domain-containing protein n=1 Tax=Sporothrix schenckii (strain ATCC 58251 / de Perez 2211183) TaxID=1391915 RepID=U7PJ43_SPOS1|nr:hypothetical protein HMPREF1624_07737 [Sporothrix schenckii ATCC 58251]
MDPPLDNTRHLRYWQRCLRTLLPYQYTANDSTRMTLGCFSVAAADVLTAGPTPTSIIPPADRKAFRSWVLACQHPGGGFAGSPTHVFPREVYGGFDFATGGPTIGAQGEANIAATLFALQLLALLASEPGSGADGEQTEGKKEGAFLGVNRNATLRWLGRLQRENGSFGEYVTEVVDPRAAGGRRTVIGGGADMRYCYIAAMIRWMLGGGRAQDDVEDIGVDALVLYIRRGQTYDGGFSESSTHESHAGYAFCSIAALELLGRAPEDGLVTTPAKNDLFARGIADIPALLRWLGSRSFLYKTKSDDDDDDEEEEEEWHESIVTNVTPDTLLQSACHPLLGFNGRCNKHADSCYTWWAVGSLTILQQNGHGLGEAAGTAAANWDASRRFLLEEMQHAIGGFSKAPGGPPDVYHSYLSLAVLATKGEPTLKAFDPAMSVSVDTVRTIEAARRGLLRGLGDGGAKRRADLLSLGKACWEANSTVTAAATAA